MRTSARRGRGVYPDVDKSGQGGGGQFLLYFCGRPLWMTPNLLFNNVLIQGAAMLALQIFSVVALWLFVLTDVLVLL